MNNIKDSSITFFSFVLSGFIGVYIYFVVVKNGSVDLLGIFNMYYLVIFVISQISMYGIHYSILREASISSSPEKDLNILVSGLLIIFLSTCITSSFVGFVNNQVGFILFLDFKKIIWPIVLLSLNKGIYSFIQGKQEFIKLGFVNPLRMGVYLYTLINLNSQGYLEDERFYTIFLNGESAVFILQIILCFFIFINKDLKFKKYGYISKHLKYSKKAFLTSFLSDINLRVDLILLSILLGSNSVGLYSYTSSIGEGFIGLINVAKTITTPKLTELVKNFETFKEYKIKIFRISNIISLALGSVILLLFKYVSNEIPYLNIYSKKPFISLCVIIIGFSLLSYFFAFEHILLQLGHPKEHSKSLIFLFITNVLLNIVLIKAYGINGAAFATVLSYFLYFCLINYYLRKKLNIQIMSLS